MGTTAHSSEIAPAGTRIGPRQNLETRERLLSATAGAVLSLVGAKRGGTLGIALGLLGGTLIGRGATGNAPIRRSFGPGPDDKAAAAKAGWSSAAVVSRSVTIGKPRAEVFAFFRDLTNLPKFMVNIDSITETDATHSHWTVIGVGGVKIEWDATTSEIKDELIEWKSAQGASVPNRGAVQFRDATGGRGTEVHATIVYRPPAGNLGRLVAKLTQKEPGIQARRDLKRLKMLLEAGEIATNAPQGSAPKS